MSDVPVWTCEFQTAPNGPALGELSVGAKFRLTCKGDIAVAWTAEPLRFKFPKDDQAFALHVLSADHLAAQSVQLTVTGYRTGEQTPDWGRVLQGEGRGFEFEKPRWAVKSVLKEGTPPQAYPSFGPWGLSLPAALWVGAALLLAATGAGAVWGTRRYLQRRRLRESLARHRSALPAAHQFYRDARQLRRRVNEARTPEAVRAVAGDLGREFRIYLTREVEVPALDWSDAAVRRDVARRRKAVHAAAGEQLAKTLRELTRLEARAAALPGEVEQILNMALDAVERIAAANAGGGR